MNRCPGQSTNLQQCPVSNSLGLQYIAIQLDFSCLAFAVFVARNVHLEIDAFAHALARSVSIQTCANLNQLEPTVSYCPQRRFSDTVIHGDPHRSWLPAPSPRIASYQDWGKLRRVPSMQLKNVETPLWLPVSGLYRHIQYNYTV